MAYLTTWLPSRSSPDVSPTCRRRVGCATPQRWDRQLTPLLRPASTPPSPPPETRTASTAPTRSTPPRRPLSPLTCLPRAALAVPRDRAACPPATTPTCPPAATCPPTCPWTPSRPWPTRTTSSGIRPPTLRACPSRVCPPTVTSHRRGLRLGRMGDEATVVFCQ